jgi:hypothetical protein
MRYAVDPRQMSLFDPSSMMFSPMTIKHLSSDWPGVFRGQMLHLMPADAFGENFDPKLGCDTKELYGMAGAIFLKEFFNLTIPQTVERYLTDAAWQYALNVNPVEASLSHATVERYQKLFVEDDLADGVFHGVTSALIEALELDVSRQRLDSTHIYSEMATFGRTKLMGVTIKRFLTQLKRHHRDLYEALDKDFLARYAPSQAKLFGDFTGSRSALRQAVAEDLLMLVSRFTDDANVSHRTTYQAMERVLHEQCDVEEETQTVERCPNGHEPVSSVYDHAKGRTRTVMAASHCSSCRENYAIRGGGESVNSGLKRKTGMGRLRVRGSPRVRMAVLLRCAGWNLFRALAALKQRGIKDLAAVFAASALIRTLVCRIIRLPEPFRRLDRRNIALWPEMSVLAPA